MHNGLENQDCGKCLMDIRESHEDQDRAEGRVKKKDQDKK